MTLSLRAWCVIFGLGCSAPTGRVAADAAQAVPAAASLEGGAASAASVDAATGLSRRIERLLPVLMSSLAAARREHEAALIRCFDRAVAELHGLRRQVAYHSERQARATEASERGRHGRALKFLAQRVDELAHSGESCFTDGVWLASGETRVDVVFAPKN